MSEEEDIEKRRQIIRKQIMTKEVGPIRRFIRGKFPKFYVDFMEFVEEFFLGIIKLILGILGLLLAAAMIGGFLLLSAIAIKIVIYLVSVI